MTGAYLMPQPLTPRSLRGDARFDLDGQYDDLVAIAQSGLAVI